MLESENINTHNQTYNVQDEIRRYNLKRYVKQVGTVLAKTKDGLYAEEGDPLLNYDIDGTNEIKRTERQEEADPERYYKEQRQVVNINSRFRMDRILKPIEHKFLRDHPQSKELLENFWDNEEGTFKNIEKLIKVLNSYQTDCFALFQLDAQSPLRPGIFEKISSQPADYTFQLPKGLNNIKTLRLLSTEIPGCLASITQDNNLILIDLVKHHCDQKPNCQSKDHTHDHNDDEIEYTADYLLPYIVVQIPPGNYGLDELAETMEDRINQSVMAYTCLGIQNLFSVQADPETDAFLITLKATTLLSGHSPDQPYGLRSANCEAMDRKDCENGVYCKETLSDFLPEHSESAPEHSKSAPEHSESAPEHSESAPEHSESAPEHSESAPEHSKSAPEYSNYDNELCHDQTPLQIDPDNYDVMAIDSDNILSSSSRSPTNNSKTNCSPTHCTKPNSYKLKFRFRFCSHPKITELSLWYMLGFPNASSPGLVESWSNLVPVASSKHFSKVVNQRPFRPVDLIPHKYIYLAIRGFGTINDPLVDSPDLFAKIELGPKPTDTTGKTLYNTFICNPKIFLETPLRLVDRLNISWLDAWGQLVDFHNQEHSLALEFVLYLDYLVDSNFSSLRGTRDQTSFTESSLRN